MHDMLVSRLGSHAERRQFVSSTCRVDVSTFMADPLCHARIAVSPSHKSATRVSLLHAATPWSQARLILSFVATEPSGAPATPSRFLGEIPAALTVRDSQLR